MSHYYEAMQIGDGLRVSVFADPTMNQPYVSVTWQTAICGSEGKLRVPQEHLTQFLALLQGAVQHLSPEAA